MVLFRTAVGQYVRRINLRGVAQLGRVCREGHTNATPGFSRAGLEPRCEGRKARLVRRRSAGGNINLRGVAQLVARLVRDQEVRGSSPRTPIFGSSKDVIYGQLEIWGEKVCCMLRLPRDPGPVRPVQDVCHWHTGPRTPISFITRTPIFGS